MKKLILLLMVGSLFGDTIKYYQSLFIADQKENVEYLGISKKRVYFLNNSNGIVENIACNSVINILDKSNESIEYDCKETNYEPIELPPREIKEKIGINSIVFGTTQFGNYIYNNKCYGSDCHLEKLYESYASYFIGIGITNEDKSIVELYFIMTNIQALAKSNSDYTDYQSYKFVGLEDSEKSVGFSYSKPISKNLYLTIGMNLIPIQRSYSALYNVDDDEITPSKLNIKFVPKPFIGCRLYVPISKKMVLPIGINYYLPSINWFADGLPGTGSAQYYNYLSVSSGIKLK